LAARLVASALACNPLLLLMMMVHGALAAYLEKPIRLVVPFAPGGTADILARALANKLHPEYGHPLIVDNRTGAGGNIGTELVAKSKPDGYTLVVGLMNTHVVNQALYANLPFRGIDDFTPIANLAAVITTMVIHPSVPARNVKEFIAFARANPGKLAYATGGNGSSNHLNAVVFERLAGIRMLHIPYKGGAPAVLDTVTGQAQVMFTAATQTLQHVKAGRLRLLGVTRGQRVALFPDVPAIAETLPNYEAVVWFGALGPAGLPRDITQRLNADMNRVMNAPDMKKAMEAMGVEVYNLSPEQFLASMRKEAAYWNKVVREFNIKVD
jgi:tripartite-type tricarboxylate transporter receptor subunit TctC